MVATNANAALGSEHRPGEVLDGAHEVRHPDVFLDEQPFDLMELRFVTGIGRLMAIDGSGRDDPDRRLMRFHESDLNRRCVRTQQPTALS